MADVVAAFQRRHRPACIDGQADLSTQQTLIRVLNAVGKSANPISKAVN